MGEVSRGTSKLGAGFVLLDKSTIATGNPLMLALVRSDGLYDIPKGVIEDGESDLAAAKRETFEECSVVVGDHDMLFNSVPHKFGRLTTFCAVTGDTPSIIANPHTGIIEHTGFLWLDIDSFCSNCLEYLIPGVLYFYSLHTNDYND